MPHLTIARIASIPETSEGAFLLCADCSVVHRVSAADRAPLYGADGLAQAADDFQEFVGQHVDHRLRVLHRSSDAEVCSHARWDPMCQVAWEVSDGERSWVVRFGREDMESPRRYTITPGELQLVSESVEVDLEVLTQTVDEALFPHAVPPRKLDALVECCRRLLASVGTDALEPIDEDRADPTVQLACLPPQVAAALATQARSLFDEDESRAIAEAVDRDLRFVIPVVRYRRLHRIVETAPR